MKAIPRQVISLTYNPFAPVPIRGSSVYFRCLS
jgi:hypothetical protein